MPVAIGFSSNKHLAQVCVCITSMIVLTPFDNLIVDFIKLRQTSTMEEYQNDFEILSNCIPRLSDDFRFSTFLSRLRDDIRIMLTMFRPTTLPIAFGLAQLYEEKVWRMFKKSKNNQHIPTNSNQQNSP